MAKRYYKFDPDGIILAIYARRQAGQPDLEYLEEPPTLPARRNFTLEIWEENVDAYLNEKIIDARSILYTSWPDSSKTIAALKARYDVFKSGTYTDFAAIDTGYNDFVSFMDLS